MNVVDIVVTGLLVVNAIMGAVRGFALQAFKLASIVLAIWMAHGFAGSFADAAAPHLGWERPQLVALGWVVIGAAVYLGMVMIGHYARGLLQRLRMGGADRALGTLLGALKGLLIAAIALHVLTYVLAAPGGSLIVPAPLESEMKSSRAFEFYLKSVQPVSEEWTRKLRDEVERNRAGGPDVEKPK